MTRSHKSLVPMAVFAAAFTMSAAAIADPGGRPGFLKATFTGSVYDGTSDIRANATEHAVFPSAVYAADLPEHTTVGYAAYMKMDGGVTYNFKGCYDDYATVKIGSSVVVSKGSECAERTGSYTPSSTDRPSPFGLFCRFCPFSKGCLLARHRQHAHR